VISCQARAFVGIMGALRDPTSKGVLYGTPT
jgi:hypothetical protein